MVVCVDVGNVNLAIAAEAPSPHRCFLTRMASSGVILAYKVHTVISNGAADGCYATLADRLEAIKRRNARLGPTKPLPQSNEI